MKIVNTYFLENELNRNSRKAKSKITTKTGEELDSISVTSNIIWLEIHPAYEMKGFVIPRNSINLNWEEFGIKNVIATSQNHLVQENYNWGFVGFVELEEGSTEFKLNAEVSWSDWDGPFQGDRNYCPYTVQVVSLPK